PNKLITENHATPSISSLNPYLDLNCNLKDAYDTLPTSTNQHCLVNDIWSITQSPFSEKYRSKETIYLSDGIEERKEKSTAHFRQLSSPSPLFTSHYCSTPGFHYACQSLYKFISYLSSHFYILPSF
ncbi:hypothetical protein HMI56_005384, partial [Coelomomyces lativittatus]